MFASVRSFLMAENLPKLTSINGAACFCVSLCSRQHVSLNVNESLNLNLFI